MTGLLQNVTIYHLWRLRRLLIVSVGLPVISMFGLWALYQPNGPLQQAGVPAILVAIWAGVAAWLAQRYPQAPLVTLAFGFGTVILIQSVPLGDWLIAQVQGQVLFAHYCLLVVLGFILWMSAANLFETVIARFVTSGRKRRFRFRNVATSSLPPDKLFSLCLPRPDSISPMQSFGPAGPDGRFPGWSAILGPMPAAATQGPWAKTDGRPPDFWVLKVTQDGAGKYTSLIATPEHETEALLTTVSAKGEGSRIEQESLYECFTLGKRIIHYLADLGTDVLVAEIDLLEGRKKARANCMQAMDYPLKSLVEAAKAEEGAQYNS